ncbi:MAG TPA: alpha/beta fold hydrolase [bacterium]|nr:alpha/beta fold hydrolase [bacterium]
MRRAALVLVGAVLAAALSGAEGREETQFAVHISAPHMLGPGRLGADVTVDGLRPEPQPTVEWTVTIGAQVIRRPPHPLIAPRVPASIDLPAGQVRVGGDVSVAEFTRVPPLEENLPVGVEITVRQGDTVAIARQTAVLLVPTVIVPGYLNDILETPDPDVMSRFARRGFSAGGPSPDLFWFPYRSRALSLRDAAATLAAYVKNVVLRATYAARINVVGYSLGGLIARWNIAFEPGWDRLVNRLILVGTPNQGAVASYVYAWYPAGILARTRAARDLLPTFPFWRPDPRTPWTIPPDGRNPTLAELNAHPLPESVRVFALYGRREAGAMSGVTGRLPDATFSFGPGDGVVLTASVLGLAVNGGGGLHGLRDRFVATVDLGPQRHLNLLWAATPRIADILVDRTTTHTFGPVPCAYRPRAREAPRVFPLLGSF